MTLFNQIELRPFSLTMYSVHIYLLISKLTMSILLKKEAYSANILIHLLIDD